MSKSKTAKKSETKAEAKTDIKPALSKKLSLLSAAAEVLKASEEPLNCKQMITLAKEKNLWEPTTGKTPEQTLYSAIVREIKEKGTASRFKKSPLPYRGHYEWNESAS